MIRASWDEFKNYYDETAGVLHYLESDDSYKCYVHNGQFRTFCEINKVGDPAPADTDQKDFEDNYKSLGNLSLVDSSGRELHRIAATQSGWAFEALNTTLETSVKDSEECDDVAGSNIPIMSFKFYDSGGTELTTQAAIEHATTGAVKSVLKIQMPYDVDLIGGMVFQNAKPSESLKLWVVVAQGLADKRMVTGLDLYHVSDIIYDGKASLRVVHEVVYNSNTFTCTLKHSSGFKHKLMIAFEYFKA